MPTRLPVHVGTDCTGMGAVFAALRNLGVSYRHRFGSELDESARQQLLALAPPDILFVDARSRCTLDLPTVDLYVCGFPCQPFSQAGLRDGFSNLRGQVFFRCFSYLKHVQPRTFILENVQGLENVDNGECFRQILLMLWSLQTYRVWFDLLDTKEHGVPQSRPRWYFVGILASADTGTFRMPNRLRPVSVERFLEPRLRRPLGHDMPPLSQSTARQNVITTLTLLRQQGQDPLEQCWILDCDSSVGRAGAMLDCSPCLTRSRAAGHWVTNRGRRMTAGEMLRLQGWREPILPCVPDLQFRRLLGNSMSVNVLERLLCTLLPAAGLWDHIPDPYQP